MKKVNGTKLPDNPAKFSDRVLHVIEPLVETERIRLGREPRILDPFAGVGKVHILGTQTYGIEIEPEWAQQHPRTHVGDSRNLIKLLSRRKRFDMVITSCTYGNRMADHHNAQERCKACGATGSIRIERPTEAQRKKAHAYTGPGIVSFVGKVLFMPCEKCEGTGRREYERNTYKHKLGRDLTEGNSGAMQWGEEYREFHRGIWAQLPAVMTESGLFVLNISDHDRKHTRQLVSKWHRDTILGQGGWRLEKTRRVKTQRLRQGQNYEKRPEFENVFAFRRVA